MPIAEIKGLSKSFGAKPVLTDVNLGFENKKIIGLLGPNGCGKTTLTKILAGLTSDYRGTVLIDGKKPGAYTKSIVSFLPDASALPNWMSVQQLVDYYADFFVDFDKMKALQLVLNFGLDLKMKYKNMSKGMKERLQIALAMSRKAKLYLLDEPLGGVDPAARSAILDLILSNYLEDSTIIISTHMVHDVERIFDDVVIMGFNEIIMQGEVETLRQTYGKSIDEIFREVFRCCVNF